jgi:hypothetical protein
MAKGLSVTGTFAIRILVREEPSLDHVVVVLASDPLEHRFGGER